MLSPLQIMASAMVATDGSGFTVMVTESIEVQEAVLVVAVK